MKICKDDLGDTGTKLFGTEVKKRSPREPTQLMLLKKQLLRSKNHLNHPHNHHLAAVFYPRARPQGREASREDAVLHTRIKFCQHNTLQLQKQPGKLLKLEEVSRPKMQGSTIKEHPVGGILQEAYSFTGANTNPWSGTASKECHWKHSQLTKVFSWV